MKTLFQNYCKGKVKHLGETLVNSKTWGEEEQAYRVVMTAESIRGYANVRIVMNDNTEDRLVVIDSDNKIVIDTPMTDPIGYAGYMEFKEIDTEFYNDILTYWDDIDMDTYIEELQNYTEKEVK